MAIITVEISDDKKKELMELAVRQNKERVGEVVEDAINYYLCKVRV